MLKIRNNLEGNSFIAPIKIWNRHNSPARPSITYPMDSFISVEDSHVDVLHEISVRLGTADGFHDVLNRVVEFASALVKCDSCLIYILEGRRSSLCGLRRTLILKSSNRLKTPCWTRHYRLGR